MFRTSGKVLVVQVSLRLGARERETDEAVGDVLCGNDGTAVRAVPDDAKLGGARKWGASPLRSAAPHETNTQHWSSTWTSDAQKRGKVFWRVLIDCESLERMARALENEGGIYGGGGGDDNDGGLTGFWL